MTGFHKISFSEPIKITIGDTRCSFSTVFDRCPCAVSCTDNFPSPSDTLNGTVFPGRDSNPQP